jgi:hypothetical protein
LYALDALGCAGGGFRIFNDFAKMKQLGISEAETRIDRPLEDGFFR